MRELVKFEVGDFVKVPQDSSICNYLFPDGWLETECYGIILKKHSPAKLFEMNVGWVYYDVRWFSPKQLTTRLPEYSLRKLENKNGI
jgi:hypothetical protein